MKRKFELIKNYPNSLDIGAIASEKDKGFYDIYGSQKSVVLQKFSVSKNLIEDFPEFWQEIKEPILITEDKVEIYEGDFYYWISKETFKISSGKANKKSINSPSHLDFASYEKLSLWLIRNKPLFSINDLLKMTSPNKFSSRFSNLSVEDLENEARQKITK